MKFVSLQIRMENKGRKVVPKSQGENQARESAFIPNKTQFRFLPS